MSTKIPLMLAALITASTACTQRNNEETATPAPASTAATADTAAGGAMAPDPAAPATMPAATAGTNPQGEALAFLVAVNEHEIAAAEQARDKQLGAAVRAYADMLHAEHSKNLADTRSVAGSTGVAISDTPAVAAQRAKGQGELEKLAALQGDAYAAAYLDAMAKGHTEALTLIDTRLMPAANDAAIKQHLTTTRGHVAKHLEAAKALQDRAG